MSLDLQLASFQKPKKVSKTRQRLFPQQEVREEQIGSGVSYRRSLHPSDFCGVHVSDEHRNFTVPLEGNMNARLSFVTTVPQESHVTLPELKSSHKPSLAKKPCRSCSCTAWIVLRSFSIMQSELTSCYSHKNTIHDFQSRL